MLGLSAQGADSELAEWKQPGERGSVFREGGIDHEVARRAEPFILFGLSAQGADSNVREWKRPGERGPVFREGGIDHEVARRAEPFILFGLSATGARRREVGVEEMPDGRDHTIREGGFDRAVRPSGKDVKTY